jgi:hypothetical protein
VAAHLWTDAPAPWEYVELVLCRDVFHCLPSQLRQENAQDIFGVLAMLEIEAQVREARSRDGGKKHS